MPLSLFHDLMLPLILLYIFMYVFVKGIQIIERQMEAILYIIKTNEQLKVQSHFELKHFFNLTLPQRLRDVFKNASSSKNEESQENLK